MTRNELNARLAAVLTTLAELNTDAAESTIYLALGMDIEKYTVIKSIMTAGDLATVRGNRIALTAKGREIAMKCNAALASGGAS